MIPLAKTVPWPSARLELQSRVARIGTLFHEMTLESGWIDEGWKADGSAMESLPTVQNLTPRDWLVEQLYSALEPGEYRKKQAKLLGATLRAALAKYRLILGGTTEPSDAEVATAFIGATSERGSDLSALLPRFSACGLAFDSQTPHFGSIAFHQFDDGDRYRRAEAFHKESFGSWGSLTAPKALRTLVREWLSGLSQGTCIYSERLKELGGIKELPADDRTLFQDFISPLLHLRQSMLLGDFGAEVPLLLLKGPGTERDPGFLWLDGPETFVKRFIENYRGCPRCSGEGAEVCQLVAERPSHLQQSIDSFLKNRVWSKRETRVKSPEDWVCRDLFELQLPFAYFGQPALFTCARGGADDADPPGGPVSLSLVATPMDDDLSAENLAQWASVLTAGLQQLVADIHAVLTAVDQRVHARRALLQSQRSAVAGLLARSMAHNVGSHLLANAAERSERIEELQLVARYVQERLGWVADAASAPPQFAVSLPLWAGVLEPFFVSERVPGASPIGSPIPKLLLHDELQAREERELSTTDGFSGGDGDPLVTVPGGPLGCHAYFAILENILRNAVKYADRADRDGKLSLHLRVSGNDSGDTLELTIWDSWSRYTEKGWQRINTYFPPWCRDSEAVDDTEKWKLLDETSKVRPGGGGIREMRAAAAWLCGLPPEHVLGATEKTSTARWVLRPVLLRTSSDARVEEEFFTGKEVESRGIPFANLHLGYKLKVPRAISATIVDAALAGETRREHRDRMLAGHGVRLASTIEEAQQEGWLKADMLILGADAIEEASTRLSKPEDPGSRLDLPARCLVIEHSLDRGAVDFAGAGRLSTAGYGVLRQSLRGSQVRRCLRKFTVGKLGTARIDRQELMRSLSDAAVSWSRACLGWASDSPRKVLFVYRNSAKHLWLGRSEDNFSIDDIEFSWLNNRDVGQLLGDGSHARRIIYDDHGSMIPRRSGSIPDPSLFASYEIVQSASPTSNLMHRLGRLPETERLMAYWSFYEAGLVSFIAADDRLSADESTKTRLGYAGITVCGEKLDEIVQAIKDSPEGRPLYGFIHFALFERQEQQSSRKAEEVIAELKHQGLREVCVTSDRARLTFTRLPRNALFLPAAPVRRYTLLGAKMPLVSMLLAARRISA